jgi:hypothetical protein
MYMQGRAADTEGKMTDGVLNSSRLYEMPAITSKHKRELARNTMFAWWSQKSLLLSRWIMVLAWKVMDEWWGVKKQEGWVGMGSIGSKICVISSKHKGGVQCWLETRLSTGRSRPALSWFCQPWPWPLKVEVRSTLDWPWPWPLALSYFWKFNFTSIKLHKTNIIYYCIDIQRQNCQSLLV